MHGLETNSGFRVQYGCGFHAPPSWRNFDASPTLKFEKLPVLGGLYTRNANRFPANVEFGDIVRGLPLPDGSCSAIYASHVLEHLSLEEFKLALKNTFRLLQSGGMFRLVVPDLETLANRYLNSNDSNAAVVFMRETSLGAERRDRNLAGFLRSWLGNSTHLWMWDLKSLTAELAEAGFVDIGKRSFGDESVFTDIEDRARFVDSVAVQARKAL